jgi:hypothetical protein
MVEGVGGVKLSSNDELGRFLENKKVQCLIDSDGDQVYGFDSLVDGGTYTLGPPQQQQQQQNGKLLCCSRIFVFYLLFEYGNLLKQMFIYFCIESVRSWRRRRMRRRCLSIITSALLLRIVIVDCVVVIVPHLSCGVEKNDVVVLIFGLRTDSFSYLTCAFRLEQKASDSFRRISQQQEA